MKVLIRYIVTGCIFLCAERFVTGSGFEPPAAPPTQFRGPPPPGNSPSQPAAGANSLVLISKQGRIQTGEGVRVGGGGLRVFQRQEVYNRFMTILIHRLKSVLDKHMGIVNCEDKDER